MPREAFEGWEPGKCHDLVYFIKKISMKAVKGNGCGEQKWKLGGTEVETGGAFSKSWSRTDQSSGRGDDKKQFVEI